MLKLDTRIIIPLHKYTFQKPLSFSSLLPVFFSLYTFMALASSCIRSSPPLSPLPVSLPVLCGISVQCGSGAATSPVLFWLDLTLLLVFSCIVCSYSLTSSKLRPVGRERTHAYTHNTNNTQTEHGIRVHFHRAYIEATFFFKVQLSTTALFCVLLQYEQCF